VSVKKDIFLLELERILTFSRLLKAVDQCLKNLHSIINSFMLNFSRFVGLAIIHDHCSSVNSVGQALRALRRLKFIVSQDELKMARYYLYKVFPGNLDLFFREKLV
jgi:hypothetical protein